MIVNCVMGQFPGRAGLRTRGIVITSLWIIGSVSPYVSSLAAACGMMSSVRALYARFRHLIHEGARFGVVGLLGLVVTDVCANLLRYQAGLGRLSSVAIAIVIATAVTFYANRYWTFRHRERTGLGRETSLFFGMNGIGVAISEVPVGLTYPLHLDSGLSYNIAVNGGIALATLFRYWSYKKWVWPAGIMSTETPLRASSPGSYGYSAAGGPRSAA